MELKDIKGLGPSRIKALNEKGIRSPIDLLNTFPTKYCDFSSIDEFSRLEGASFTLKATLVEEAKAVYFKGLSYTIATFRCTKNGKKFKAVWFKQPFMKNNLRMDSTYFLMGKVNKKGQLVVSKSYEASRIDDTLVPIYGSSAGLSSAIFSTSVKNILESGEKFSLIDGECGEIDVIEAYREIHFPTNLDNLENAKKRISLEDLVLLASLESKISANKTEKNRAYKDGLIEEFKELCPFELTVDQNKVLSEIEADMLGKMPMNRLVVGDVGSGKTMVALGALYLAIKSGYQGVMLCPTEILAKQHCENAKKIFANLGFEIQLLVGSLKSKEKKEVVEKINCGESRLIIATHAALSEDVKPPRLALVITDEQHRFGVGHRAILSSKGNEVDSIVMSATPIPRSLALVLFGGLSSSTINSRPFGESKISTSLVSMEKETSMWEFIKKEISQNSGKCFVVAPRISEGENEEIYSVSDIKEKLVCDFGFNENKIAVVHGKMKKEESDSLINEFKNGAKDILISTTIIEVGIDVKEANIMVIYNSERFGLASLHQLRGRVGRDGREGYCFCMLGTSSEQSVERIKLFKKYNDGIKLAEEDLKLRGAGTIYGTKQSGTSEVFLKIDFSLDEYNKAKEIFKSLSEAKKDELVAIAEERFGDIYKKVVLN